MKSVSMYAHLLLTTFTIVASSAFSAESTVGKWRGVEVSPDPVYVKKAGRFVSSIGRLEITTPDCYALSPEGEEEGQDPAKSDDLYAARSVECKQPGSLIKSIGLTTHIESPQSHKYCSSVIGGTGGYFAAETMQIAGHESCSTARTNSTKPDEMNDVWWEFEGFCPKTTFQVVIIRTSTPTDIVSMKKSRKLEIPTDVKTLIDSIHCLEK